MVVDRAVSKVTAHENHRPGTGTVGTTRGTPDRCWTGHARQHRGLRWRISL